MSDHFSKMNAIRGTEQRDLFSACLYFGVIPFIAIYLVVALIHSSFHINEQQYFCLIDDAMISMKYADNASKGRGLIWSPGDEAVEGFSNPLYVVVMYLVHKTGLGSPIASLPVQLFNILFHLISTVLVFKISHYGLKFNRWVSVGALLLFALHQPMVYWTISGMEAPAQVCLVLWAFYLFITNKSPKFIYILLAVGTFLRLDMVLIYILFIFLLAIRSPRQLKKTVLPAVVILSVALIFQTYWRYSYYQEFFPNPVYLKATGVPMVLKISRGLLVLLRNLWQMNVLLVILPVLYLRWNPSRQAFLCFGIFLVQAVYSVLNGGDFERSGENDRFLLTGIPFFFILYSESIYFFLKEGFSKFKVGLSRHLNRSYVLLIVVSLLIFNIRDMQTFSRFFQLTPPVYVMENERMVQRAMLIETITRPQARIGVVWAGVFPYFTNRKYVDLLGKNEKVIAKSDIEIPEGMTPLNLMTYYIPGHLKWDFEWVFEKKRPDVLVDLHWLHPLAFDKIKPYLNQDYVYVSFPNTLFNCYILKNSPNVNWNHEFLRAANI